MVRDRRPAIKIGTGNPLKMKPSVHPALRDGSPPKKINNTKVPPSLPRGHGGGGPRPREGGGRHRPMTFLARWCARLALVISPQCGRGVPTPGLQSGRRRVGALSGVFVGRLRTDFAGFAHRKQAESLRSKLPPPRSSELESWKY